MAAKKGMKINYWVVAGFVVLAAYLMYKGRVEGFAGPKAVKKAEGDTCVPSLNQCDTGLTCSGDCDGMKCLNMSKLPSWADINDRPDKNRCKCGRTQRGERIKKINGKNIKTYYTACA